VFDCCLLTIGEFTFHKILTISLAPVLAVKQVSLSCERTCVRSCMIYGSETWAMKVEHERKLMKIIRIIYGVSLMEKRTSKDLKHVETVIRRSGLRWSGHVTRKDENDGVKKCMKKRMV